MPGCPRAAYNAALCSAAAQPRSAPFHSGTPPGGVEPFPNAAARRVGRDGAPRPALTQLRCRRAASLGGAGERGGTGGRDRGVRTGTGGMEPGGCGTQIGVPAPDRAARSMRGLVSAPCPWVATSRCGPASGPAGVAAPSSRSYRKRAAGAPRPPGKAASRSACLPAAAGTRAPAAAPCPARPGPHRPGTDPAARRAAPRPSSRPANGCARPTDLAANRNERAGLVAVSGRCLAVPWAWLIEVKGRGLRCAEPWEHAVRTGTLRDPRASQLGPRERAAGQPCAPCAPTVLYAHTRTAGPQARCCDRVALNYLAEVKVSRWADGTELGDPGSSQD